MNNGEYLTWEMRGRPVRAVCPPTGDGSPLLASVAMGRKWATYPRADVLGQQHPHIISHN